MANLFTGMTYAGDNFVIGQFTENLNQGFFNPLTVSLYADNDGWLMAYVSRELLTSAINYRGDSVPWGTALAAALNRAAGASGAATTDITESEIGYYHWGFPLATHLAIGTRFLNGNVYIAIPATATMHDVSVVSACRPISSFAPSVAMSFDGDSFTIGSALCQVSTLTTRLIV